MLLNCNSAALPPAPSIKVQVYPSSQVYPFLLPSPALSFRHRPGGMSGGLSTGVAPTIPGSLGPQAGFTTAWRQPHSSSHNILPFLAHLLHFILYSPFFSFSWTHLFTTPASSFLCPNSPQINNSSLIPFPHWSQIYYTHAQLWCFLYHFLGNYTLTCAYWCCYLDGDGLASLVSLLTLQLYFFPIQCFLDRIFSPELWHPCLLLTKHKQFGYQSNGITHLVLTPYFCPQAFFITPLVPTRDPWLVLCLVLQRDSCSWYSFYLMVCLI